MIKTEIITIKGVQFQKTWSDIDNNVWEPGIWLDRIRHYRIINY